MSEPALIVVHPGLYTLVVDEGRPRSRSLGVPVGGAADRWSLALGNALVGNPPDSAALECALAGPTLQACCDLGCVVFGAPFDLTSDRQRLATGKTFTLHAGEKLRINGTTTGMRAYFCVRGGLQSAVVLGSRSGLAPVRMDDVLHCSPGTMRARSFAEPPVGSVEPGVLRTLDGAQVDWFTASDFYEQTFSVTPAGNRMGLRLQGTPLALPSRELVSEPVCPGAVQVTRDGQCIVLGVDGQTIGGYPKIAQVIAADLDELGQLRPGASVRFRRVTLAAAEEAYRARQATLREWLARLRAGY